MHTWSLWSEKVRNIHLFTFASICNFNNKLKIKQKGAERTGEEARMKRWPSYSSLSLISIPWGREAGRITGPQHLRNVASHSKVLVAFFSPSVSAQSSCENASWLMLCSNKIPDKVYSQIISDDFNQCTTLLILLWTNALLLYALPQQYLRKATFNGQRLSCSFARFTDPNPKVL